MDINTAGIDELMILLGIGQKTAEKIIVKRKELGQYNSLEDIMLVPSICAKHIFFLHKYESIKWIK